MVAVVFFVGLPIINNAFSKYGDTPIFVYVIPALILIGGIIYLVKRKRGDIRHRR